MSRNKTEGDLDAWDGIASRSSINDHYTGVSLLYCVTSGRWELMIRGVSTVYEALPENDEEHHNDSTTHAIGLALLSGFALMLL
jgi:hypothetical protein